MGSDFKETSHLKIDRKKFESGYDFIFSKKILEYCHVCKKKTESVKDICSNCRFPKSHDRENEKES